MTEGWCEEALLSAFVLDWGFQVSWSCPHMVHPAWWAGERSSQRNLCSVPEREAARTQWSCRWCIMAVISRRMGLGHLEPPGVSRAPFGVFFLVEGLRWFLLSRHIPERELQICPNRYHGTGLLLSSCWGWIWGARRRVRRAGPTLATS